MTTLYQDQDLISLRYIFNDYDMDTINAINDELNTRYIRTYRKHVNKKNDLVEYIYYKPYASKNKGLYKQPITTDDWNYIDNNTVQAISKHFNKSTTWASSRKLHMNVYY